MKLIFSRKGIDDAYGQGASPIFPDGHMLSIPIPIKKNEKGLPYKHIYFKGTSYRRIISQLELPIKKQSCHFDPDLNPSSVQRHASWLPCLGHHGAAAKHLFNQGIELGDVFLFFGSFRHVQLEKYKQWKFVKSSVKKHILFGFLEVGKVLDLTKQEQKAEAISLGYQNHPHIVNDYPGTNVLFIAKAGESSSGTFAYHDDLVLTCDGSTKSIWSLPGWFYELQISRHDNRERFKLDNGKTILKTVGIGQDFVVEPHPESTVWLKSLKQYTSNSSIS